MPRFPTRPALALLGTLLSLAACAPTASRPAATPFATPARVPADWKVLDTPHFSLAYPSDWTAQPPYINDEGSTVYNLGSPDIHGVVSAVWVEVLSPLPAAAGPPTYCAPASDAVRHTTFAGLPMTFSIQGEGGLIRVWEFANAQRTVYTLFTGDAQDPPTMQTQDEAILATFRPDNATPWSC